MEGRNEGVSEFFFLVFEIYMANGDTPSKARLSAFALYPMHAMVMALEHMGGFVFDGFIPYAMEDIARALPNRRTAHAARSHARYGHDSAAASAITCIVMKYMNA